MTDANPPSDDDRKTAEDVIAGSKKLVAKLDELLTKKDESNTPDPPAEPAQSDA